MTESIEPNQRLFRRALVTGADGFVGSWLVPALAAKGMAVSALVRSNSSIHETTRQRFSSLGVDVITGDVTDLPVMCQLLADTGIDCVYHLAALNINIGSGISPYEVFETNTRGVYTVLEASRAAPTRARVIVSSSKEVEDCFSERQTRKSHPYMTSKAAAELIARAYHDTFDVPVALVRCDNLYGPGDFNWARLVPGTIRAVLHGETPVIRSNGLLERDYVYIEDAVAAYIAVGERIDDASVNGGLFRVATGIHTTVRDVVQKIGAVAGIRDFEPRVLGEVSDERVDTPYVPAFERDVLGWKAEFSVDQGLSRTVEWYRSHFDKETPRD